MVDAQGEEILDFSYSDNWYPITDGLGFSLVVVNENAEPDAWNDKPQWRASGQLGGSPGAVDPAPPVIGAVVINEVLSRSETPPLTNDYIEIFNPATNTVDVGGWYLTDDFNTPKKYRIADGTTMAPGTYRLFDETQFNPTPGTAPSFALGADGEEVYLFSADAAGNLTGYYHGMSFGPAENGVSFGRHVTSEGREYLVAQVERTPGTNNAGIVVGPLVIGELMYHPPEIFGADNSVDEFIEVRNITTNEVVLFDAATPTNGWKITGGVGFEFPTNTTLAGGEYVLLANFNPADTNKLEAFRAKYGVAGTVRVLGPYEGKLNNDQDEVEIKKPTRLLGGVVAYVMVDKVNYEDGAPWAEGADGFGLSLQRKDAGAYGNDPANWLAALPTAAGATGTGGTAPVITGQSSNVLAVAYSPLSLTVTATGDPTLRYQWRFEGQPVAGGTNATLQIASVTTADIGTYQVVVYNDYGSATSTNIDINVVMPAAILQQPVDVSLFPRNNAAFSVLAYSSSPLRYQWRFNGVDIPGATNSSYIRTNAQPADSGPYTVVVTDGVGPIISRPATLTVYSHPLFTVQPTNRVVALNTSTSLVTVTLTAAATSSTPVRYQWLFNNTLEIPGATNASLVISNIQPSQEGNYAAVATDAYGSLTSTNAYITVTIKPAMLQQPAPQTVGVGENLVFTVAVTGTEPFYYRWRRNANGNIFTNPIMDTSPHTHGDQQRRVDQRGHLRRDRDQPGQRRGGWSAPQLQCPGGGGGTAGQPDGAGGRQRDAAGPVRRSEQLHQPFRLGVQRHQRAGCGIDQFRLGSRHLHQRVGAEQLHGGAGRHLRVLLLERDPDHQSAALHQLLHAAGGLPLHPVAGGGRPGRGRPA